MSWTRWIAVCLVLAAATLTVSAQQNELVLERNAEPPLGNGPYPGQVRGVAPTEWEELSSWDPVQALPGDSLVVNFGQGRGLWLRNDESEQWTRLTPWGDAQLLRVACRKLFATFSEHPGLFLFDGTQWTRLTSWSPDGLIPQRAGGILADFGPGRGLWVWNCPAALACDFLDGTTWILTEDTIGIDCPSGTPEEAGVLRVRMVGNDVYIDEFWEQECTFSTSPSEAIALAPDCSFTSTWQETEQLDAPYDCTYNGTGEDEGRATETALTATYHETDVFEGSNCPPGVQNCEYVGVAVGIPCDPEVCWPCGDPTVGTASKIEGSWSRIPRAHHDLRQTLPR